MTVENQGTPATGEGAAAPAGTPAGAADPFAWVGTNLDDDTKGYVQNKGWKAGADVVTGYRNLEKLHGVPADRLLKLPKDDGTAEEWAAVHTKLGRPVTAAEYKLDIPKENGSPEFAAAAAGKFHELGLSAKQAAGLNKWWNEQAVANGQQATAASQATWAQEVEQIKQSQGAALEQNSAIVDKAAAQFGVDSAKLDALRQAMGPKGAFDFLLSIGKGLGEHTFEGTGSTNSSTGKLTPEQAKLAIKDLRQDKDFVTKYTRGDIDAKRRMDDLHRYAYPES